MPTKDIDILSGTLYLDNEPIMELDKCEICEPPIYADEVPKVMKFSESQEVTFELTNVRLNRNALLSVLYGRNVTNNWLKKQGGVMNRKERRKRERKK